MTDVSGTRSDSSTGGSDLPVLRRAGDRTGEPPRGRADARRNRVKVLDAAERLFARDGVEGVTMQAVATEAGVGVGTLYRGFGDKAGLAVALLDEREREFQQRMIFGPPPLGPGADPRERLAAFVAEFLVLVAGRVELVVLSQTASPGARFRTGAHALWLAHCRHLFDEAGAPAPAVRAEALLAAMSGEMVAHWLDGQERVLEGLTRDLCDLARALAG